MPLTRATQKQAVLVETSLFGFSDAFKRYLATNPTLSVSSAESSSAAHAKHGGEWAADLMKQAERRVLRGASQTEQGQYSFRSVR